MDIVVLSPPGRYCQGPSLTFDRAKNVGLVPLTVEGAIGVVSSLVMKWDAKLNLLRLGHLGLGAWTSRQIRVSPTRGKVRRSGREVVLRKRGDASTDVVSVLLRRVGVRLVSTRVE